MTKIENASIAERESALAIVRSIYHGHDASGNPVYRVGLIRATTPDEDGGNIVGPIVWSPTRRGWVAASRRVADVLAGDMSYSESQRVGGDPPFRHVEAL